MSTSTPEKHDVEIPVVTGFDIVPTGEEGIHTGKPRFRVTCQSCGGVAHENTTNPQWWADIHNRENHY